ncbi:hypothetical protein KQI69_08445, partial [Eubacterium sp. MSJ-13]|uniref:hypothetical protein n=1 Tax=Eubacterium sp. MSJ-13 TaxID=2841513 RepID=UPI001C125508
MDRLKENIKKKWKFMAGLTVMFMFVFVVGFAVKAHFTTKAADTDLDTGVYTVVDSAGKEIVSGQDYIMRRLTDILTVSVSGQQADSIKYTWKTLNPDVLFIGNSANNYGESDVTGNGTSSTVRTKALKQGEAGLSLFVEAKVGTTTISKTFRFTIQVQFSINEYLSRSTGIQMQKIYSSDERPSIIMDYHKDSETKLQFGSDADKEQSKLNLMFGDATKGQWVSSNTDVVEVVSDGIVATGPGRVKLTVTYASDTDKTKTYDDSIWVYVRPEVIYESVTGKGDDNGEIVNSDKYTKPLVVQNGDYLDCQVKMENDSNISNKLEWVISKEIGGSTGTEVLVRDSKGDYNPDYKDDAQLVWQPSLHKYQLKAKSETYIVKFYVAGTYPGFEKAQDPDEKSKCEAVKIAENVQVRTSYEEKNITINIGGNYNLSDGFNISLKGLKENFTGKPNPNYNGTDSSNLIDFNNDTWTITTKK